MEKHAVNSADYCKTIADLLKQGMNEINACDNLDDAKAAMSKANSTLSTVVGTPAIKNELCTARFCCSHLFSPSDIERVSDLSSAMPGINYSYLRIFLPGQAFGRFWSNDQMKRFGIEAQRRDSIRDKDIRFEFVELGERRQRGESSRGRGGNSNSNSSNSSNNRGRGGRQRNQGSGYGAPEGEAPVGELHVQIESEPVPTSEKWGNQ